MIASGVNAPSLETLVWGQQQSLQNDLLAMETGSRLADPANNPAASAIATLMGGQLGATTQAMANVSQGLALLNTANGGIQTDIAALTAMEGIVVQAGNSTLSPADRTALQQQITGLLQQIETTAQTTQYNGIPLLNGQWQTSTTTLSTSATASVTTYSLATVSLYNVVANGAGGFNESATVPGKVTGDVPYYTVPSFGTVPSFAAQQGGTSSQTIDVQNSNTTMFSPWSIENVDMLYTAPSNATIESVSFQGYGAYMGGAPITQYHGWSATAWVGGSSVTAWTAPSSASETVSGAVSIAMPSGTTQFAAGDSFINDTGTGTTPPAPGAWWVGFVNPIVTLRYTETSAPTSTASGTTITTGGMILQTGGTDAQPNHLRVNLGAATLSALGLSNLSVISAASTAAALTQVQAALGTLTATQGTLGSQIDALQSRYDELQAATKSLFASQSTLRAAPMPQVTAAMARSQTLLHTGLIALSDTQHLAHSALKLLRF